MVQPLRQDQYVDQLLTQFSTALFQDPDAFIARRVMPELEVKKETGGYSILDQAPWYKTKSAKRSPASESVGTDYTIDNSPRYVTDTWAVHYDIPWGDYDNTAGEPIDVEYNATSLVVEDLKLRRERLFVGTYMAPGQWKGFKNAGGSQVDFEPAVHGTGYWDVSTSNPTGDTSLAKLMGRRQSGQRFETMVVSEDVDSKLRNNVSILSRINGGATPANPAFITDQTLAGYFNVNRYLVAGAVQNSAQDGQPDVYDFIASNCALLVHATDRPSLNCATAGLILNWSGASGAGPAGNLIRRIEMPWKKCTRIEAEMAFAMVQTGPTQGVFFKNVLQPV